MAPNAFRVYFPIRHFVCNYTHNSKSKGRIATFYLANDCSTIVDIYSLGQSCIRDTIGELWIQIPIAANFGYDILGVLTLITRELQVVCGRFTHRTTVILLEMYIFCVRAGFEIQIASYASKHASQSLSDRPFYAYSVLRCITQKLKVVRESSAYPKTAILIIRDINSLCVLELP